MIEMWKEVKGEVAVDDETIMYYSMWEKENLG